MSLMLAPPLSPSRKRPLFCPPANELGNKITRNAILPIFLYFSRQHSRRMHVLTRFFKHSLHVRSIDAHIISNLTSLRLPSCEIICTLIHLATRRYFNHLQLLLTCVYREIDAHSFITFFSFLQPLLFVLYPCACR